jgi:predicted dehydrogenase
MPVYQPSRRQLLRGAVASTVVGPYVSVSPSVTRPAGGAELLRVGLIGCGGRGTGAAVNALRADPNTKLVALGDVFADQLESSLSSILTAEDTADVAARVDVPPERRFVGWDAYQGVIASCDVVLLATSPHFRPLHLAAAVEAGKHCFVEKPVATDAPGVARVREACARAKEKRLAVVTGLCYRYERKKRETIQRLHDGAVGEIVALHTTYNASALWHRGRKPEWTEMEYQMRNWLYFHWLSGDHIAEQHIHSLDKLAWIMGEYPARCLATGGRAARVEPEFGDVYDHFSTVYEWKNGVRGFAYCRQFGGAVQTEVSDWVFGTRGRCNVQEAAIDGGPGWSWRWRPAGEDDLDDMYQNEHDALFAAIRAGEPIDDGPTMCDSTLMALMGRMSAYSGQALTWEQAASSQEDLRPKSYAFGPVEPVPVARPGVTQFV